MKNQHSIPNPAESNFEALYTRIRDAEGRLYSDEEVKQLPYLKQKSKHYPEWKIRAKTLQRFLHYLSKTKTNSLLEIGCGNGWFTHQCSNKVNKAIGIDVNQLELEQATRVFTKNNLNFYYWDLFTAAPFEEKFDCIVLNAVVQYFPDFGKLISRLKELLTEKGEIHLLDSPFYQANELAAARKRSLAYYSSMNLPEMTDHYFHHTTEDIKGFIVHYSPKKNLLKRFFGGKDSPFPWVSLKNNY